MTTLVQLKGSLKLAEPPGPLVDYSNFVSKAMLRTNRAEVAIPATLGTGRASKSAGVEEESIELTFHSSIDASSIAMALYDVIKTPTAEVMFEVVMDEGVVGPNNPKWTGTAVLFAHDLGNDVGSLRQNTMTLAVTGAGTTFSTTP